MDPEGRTENLMDLNERMSEFGNDENSPALYTAVTAVPPEVVEDNMTALESYPSGSDDEDLLPLLVHEDECQDRAVKTLERSSTVTRVNNSEKELLRHCKLYSLGLGLLVGCFIQFSSLGANFLLAALFGRPCQVAKSKIVAFSLAWSFFTSSIGVLILLLVVRSLVPIAWTTSLKSQQGAAMWLQYANEKKSNNRRGDENTVTLPERALLLMECFFAIGALVGVCISWICTDILLGFHGHIVHSLATLAAALAWCKVIAFSFGYDKIKSKSDEVTENNGDLTKPLLSDTEKEQEHIIAAAASVEVPKTDFKLSSLALGLLVGCFIQLSSLGANFLLSALYGSDSNHKVGITKQEIFWFSFIWSFFTSTMGIFILILLRSLILTSYKTVMKQSPASDCNNKLTERMVMHMECFFAFGALLGVSVAWIVTDAALGLQMHTWHSITTLALALIWCKAVIYCFGYCPDEDGDDDDYEEVEKAVLAPKILADGVMVV